jgi:hypothetical protein
VLHELAYHAHVGKRPSPAGQQSEMRASGPLHAVLEEPANCGKRNSVVDVAQGARIEASVVQDCGVVDAELAQTPRELDQTPYPLAPGIGRRRRFTAGRNIFRCLLRPIDSRELSQPSLSPSVESCQSGQCLLAVCGTLKESIYQSVEPRYWRCLLSLSELS